MSNKLNALTRFIPYLDKKQINPFYKCFFKGKLSYCPLIWTFCSRCSKIFINKLQERALRTVYNNYGSSFNKLLQIANEKTMHINNINNIMTENYNFLNALPLLIISEIFLKKDGPYSLRNSRSLITNCKSTVKNGIDSIVYKDPQIWQTLPTDFINSESLSISKCSMKKLRDINFQYKICKTYIRKVGYVD